MRLVILGGGISELEAAVYAREAGLDATIVGKAPHVMPQQPGPAAAAVLERQLRETGVVLRTGRLVTKAAKGSKHLTLPLDDGEQVACDLCLTTVGAVPNASPFKESGLKANRGIIADARLRGAGPVFLFPCLDN
jgi:3-phenylpropionate/trans-cinnamate dioxygenase ferredoxin reductase subunit